MLRTCLRSAQYCTQQYSHPQIRHSLGIRLWYLPHDQIRISRNLCTKLDNKNNEKIYTGPLTPHIKGVKIFSLGSSVTGLLAQPIIIQEANAIGSTSLLVGLCSIVGFFTFVTPVLLHMITKKYVTELHYNSVKSNYTAVTYNFFLRRKELTFKTEEVDVPELPGMFTTFKVKGKALFVEPRHFTDPIYYAKIMGYDKPMDFKLGPDETK